MTEYAQEIFDLVDAINTRGFAFEDNGSVYFYGTKYNILNLMMGHFQKIQKTFIIFPCSKKPSRMNQAGYTKQPL